MAVSLDSYSYFVSFKFLLLAMCQHIRANENKQKCNIARCLLISGNRATLPQCGKKDVFPCGLRSRSVKRK